MADKADKKEEPIKFKIGNETFQWAVDGFQIKYKKAPYNFDKKKLEEYAKNAESRKEFLEFILQKCPGYLKKVAASAPKKLEK